MLQNIIRSEYSTIELVCAERGDSVVDNSSTIHLKNTKK